MLGLCYIHALGTPKDEYQAAHWFELARQQEHIDAYFNLGCAYLHGMGVEENRNKANKLKENLEKEIYKF